MESDGYASNRYQFLGLLGTGGMARVHLARARGPGGMDRLVVIKRPLSHLAQDPEFVRMFLDEARIASTLHHANIAQVYDVEQVNGSVSIVMEYLHGHDVRDVTRALGHEGRPLPLEHALAIVLGVSSGLSYAHSRKDLDGRPLEIVHRDVSPHNVFVTFDGEVKLIDFGVARAARRGAHTASGTIKGKLGYMAPEQILGESVDLRADLFSLGVILYELTTGERLFEQTTDYHTMHSTLYDDPPLPSSRVDGYPRELEEIVLKCLARDPQARYRSARELTLDLEEFVRRERRPVSAVGLADFMAALFPDELASWRAAQDAGQTLGEHLEATRTVLGLSTMTDPAPAIARTPARVAPRRRTWFGVGLFACVIAGAVAISRTGRNDAPPARSAVTPDSVVQVEPTRAARASSSGADAGVDRSAPPAGEHAAPPGAVVRDAPSPAPASAAPTSSVERPRRAKKRTASRRVKPRQDVRLPANRPARPVDPDGLLID